MPDKGLTEFKSFTGNLKAGSDSVPITFQACIDKTGEVKFKFETITLTAETSFIKSWWNREGSNVNYFSLSGKVEDGTEFETEDLCFNRLPIECNEAIGGCRRAEFNIKLPKPVPKPLLYMRVKGFQNLRTLTAECHLGKVVMDGESSIDDPNAITGYIAVQSDDDPEDLTAWHVDAEKLLDHVRRVMSFASATMLQGPIIEFHERENLKVVVLSQSRQASAHFPAFPYTNLQPVFYTAVTSFFVNQLKVKNLFFAIEWFAMESTHNEVRLVNAMTVLENLVFANLSGDDTFIIPEKEFKQTKRALKEVLNQFIEKKAATTDDAKEILLKALNDSLLSCNGRSILNKLLTLAEHWSVPLHGISKDKIEALIKARNHIVHRGHYYEGKKSDDLWDHITIAREIVVRFILATIGYRGDYISYIDGYHNAQFPPKTNVKDAN